MATWLLRQQIAKDFRHPKAMSRTNSGFEKSLNLNVPVVFPTCFPSPLPMVSSAPSPLRTWLRFPRSCSWLLAPTDQLGCQKFAIIYPNHPKSSQITLGNVHDHFGGNLEHVFIFAFRLCFKKFDGMLKSMGLIGQFNKWTVMILGGPTFMRHCGMTRTAAKWLPVQISTFRLDTVKHVDETRWKQVYSWNDRFPHHSFSLHPLLCRLQRRYYPQMLCISGKSWFLNSKVTKLGHWWEENMTSLVAVHSGMKTNMFKLC